MKRNSTFKVLTAILMVFIISACSSTGYLVFKKLTNLNRNRIETSYVDAGEFIVNINGESGNNYFKGKVYVGYNKSDKKAKKELVKNKQLPIVTGTINSYFRGKDYDFLNNANNQEQIKDELVKEINKQLETCRIPDVRFYSYLLQ